VGESARMHSNPRRTILFLAAVVALAVAATAWADTGANGGTSVPQTPPVQKSGGVAGPDKKEEPKPARSAQTTTPEEPPQVETTPTETAPTETPEPGTETTEAPTATAPSAGTGATTGGGGGGGGLPQIGALAAVGLGLLLAGVTLRRWREA
jgi:outer membrane biosynthesis protein TonB